MDSQETNQRLAVAVRGLMLSVDRYRRVIAEQYNISVPAVIVLGDLYQQGRLTPRSIATRLAWTTGGVTALLDRLERGGYVTRIPNPADRRSVLIESTPQGQQAMHQAFHLLENAVNDSNHSEGFDPEQLIAVLTRTAEALEQHTDLTSPASSTNHGP
jgi:DNA-binding MarR family transcriptional regulator